MNRVMRQLKKFLVELDVKSYKGSAYNLLLRENIKQSFKGSWPALRIDYTKLILSKGRLPNAPAMSVCSPRPENSTSTGLTTAVYARRFLRICFL